MAQPADTANRSNQQIIQQFEQQRLERERQRIIERDRRAIQNDLTPGVPDINNKGPCIDIDKITVKGATKLSDDDLDSIISFYEGQCLFISEINAVVEQITNLYIDRGYVTSKAYLVEQDLSDGELEILMVEGILEGIRSQDNQTLIPKSRLETAFGKRDGKVLNLRHIEQGLDQINRLQSNNASVDFVPGEQAGGTLLHLKNEESKRWHIETGFDNTGTENTGEEQAFINAQYDNLLNLNDLLLISFKHDVIGANRRQSRNFSAFYDIPYGYWNFNYSINYFNYVSEVSSAGTDFKTDGFSRVHTFGVRRVIHRDAASITSLTSSLVARENENFIESVQLNASSQKLTLLNFGVTHSRNFDGTFVFGGLTYTRGTGWLGAQEDTTLASEQPQAEFDRVTADISFIKQTDFGWGTYNPRLLSTARGQWSRDELFGSEQISIGGPFSVRGFKESSISGDSGAYITNEISVPLSSTMFSDLQKYVGQVRPFIGFDAGVVRSDNGNEFEGGTVRSWSAGLKNEGGLLDFKIEYSKPISSPAFINEENHDLFFKASLKF